MTNALAIYKDFDGLQRAAMALYKSGYFDDAKSEAQAIVKVMAGAEVGIPAFASMTGINIIQGKPAFGANLIATLVDNHPRYDYQVIRADDEACVIAWFKDKKKVGESSFTMEEAKTIKQWNSKKNAFEPLTAKFNWQNWPSDMLFARAITRGQKRYAAGVAGGAPLYTAEELGADYDENGNVIDMPSVTISTPEPITYEDIVLDEPEPDPEPEPIYPTMTLEYACNVQNSDGELYGQLDNEKLANMTIGINKGLKKAGITDEQRETYEMKLTAIKTILQSRDEQQAS